MAKIKDIISLKKDIVFGGAVQTDWYYDKSKAKTISQSFIFHGPQFFGVTQDDVEYKTHKLMDTCSFTNLIANKLNDDEGNSIVLTIAGYGTGKSHLAVTLGNLFSHEKESDIYKDIVSNLRSADIDISENIEDKTSKPNLVIVLNGMKDFNLNYEILSTAKKVLSAYGYGEEIFSEYTKAYNIAQTFLDRNFENFKDKFLESTSKRGINVINLKKHLMENIYKDEIFDSINDVYSYVTGSPIRWDEGISSADVLGKLVDKMCGTSGHFNKILILFDEFGRYIEYASDYPNRAGDSALQQIFEVIQDSNNNILFIGFIQSDLKTYLARVNKTSNISRYIGRYEAGEKIYLSSNLETIFANLIKPKDIDLYSNYIESKLRNEKVEQKNKVLFNKINEWIPGAKGKGVWNNWEKFSNVILKGVYPFHPITTWMLSYLSDWYQQRSAINFLIGCFENIEEKEITEFGDLPVVLPIDIIKGDFFKELLLAESEGRQKSEYCTLYDRIYIKYKDKLNKTELDILSGILILKLGKFRTSNKEDVLLALEYITNIKSELLDGILTNLENNYGMIAYDEKTATFDFIEDATGINDFNRFIRRKKSNLESIDLELLLNNDIKQKLGINSYILTDFGARNNIKTSEWQYEQDIVTSKRIDNVYVQNLINDFNNSTNPSKPKGKIIYIYNNKDNNIDELNKLKDLYNQYNLDNYPIIWILLDDRENDLYNLLIDSSIIPKFTQEETMKFAKFMMMFTEKVNDGLVRQFNNMLQERNVFTNEGLKKSSLRIKNICNKRFEDLYKRIISFPFEGFANKNLGAPKKIHAAISKGILSGQLNYQWIQLQNKDIKNRIDIVLRNKMVGWGVLDDEFRIITPKNINLKSIYDEIRSMFDGNEVNLYDLYKKYTHPPYTFNDYSFALAIAIYIAVEGIEIKIFKGNKPIKTIDWVTEFYKEKDLDFKYLKDCKLVKVDLGEYLTRYKVICDKIERNTDIDICIKLKSELYQLLSEEEPPEEFKLKVEGCKMLINQGEKLYNKTKIFIGEMKHDLEKGIRELDFKHINKVALKCEKITPTIEEGLSYQYSEKYMTIFGDLLDKARDFIEKEYVNFLNKNAKCYSIAQVTGYEKWMKLLAEDLRSLGYDDYARLTINKLEEQLDNLDNIKKIQTINENVKNYLDIVKPSEYSTQEELLQWKKQGEELIDIVRYHDVLDKNDKEAYITSLETRLETNNKFLHNINNSIMDIIDRALEVTSIREAKNIINEIQYVMSKKLRPIDREEIETIGQVVQNLIKDIEEMDNIDKFNIKIDEAKLLKGKYEEFEDIVAVESIINSYIQSINDKIDELNIKWINMHLGFDIKDIDSWDSDMCFRWIKETRGTPEYLIDSTVSQYNEYKNKVDNRISSLNMDSILSMFRDLSLEKKEECISLLSNILEELSSKVN
ncbi:hypothetical protein [Alkalithermobacter paradoxus]|uniref:Uncharacterized protein n=1 Tax=Alkalithermobacter paradoxus TaxID=29349 RepID=A0A1V4I6N6_9FIRM|nr:hypothetical protein CLOTH_14110 [[Clostridium] thermoalcaliphilum]